MEKTYDMEKFAEMHKTYFPTALAEVKRGCKESHWIWFVFPQMLGLGLSYKSNYYGMHGIGEARQFINHPYLGQNLNEICQALLELEGLSASQIFRSDAKKLRSSMTLFALATDENSVYQKVLDKYFGGQYDGKTIDLLKKAEE